MSGLFGEKHRILFLVFAVACTTLGLLRLYDRGNEPYDGYLTDGDKTVIRVDPGGPAAVAGLQVGDRLRSIDGIPFEDARARTRQPRGGIGQSTTLEFERPGGSESDGPPTVLSLSFNHAAPPTEYAALNLAGFVIGLSFLLSGLIACFKVSVGSGKILALAGLCLGAAFLGVPYFASSSVRMVAQAILGVALVLGFASLFHFMMEFPKPKALLRRRHARAILYGPALVVALYLLFLVIVQPPASGALYRWGNLLFGLFLVAYFGGAALAMLHSYLRATSSERSRYGLHIELAGILLGILPVTIEAVLRMFIPSWIPPGADLYFLTVIFIPIALVSAVLRQQRAAALPARHA